MGRQDREARGRAIKIIPYAFGRPRSCLAIIHTGYVPVGDNNFFFFAFFYRRTPPPPLGLPAAGHPTGMGHAGQSRVGCEGSVARQPNHAYTQVPYAHLRMYRHVIRVHTQRTASAPVVRRPLPGRRTCGRCFSGRASQKGPGIWSVVITVPLGRDDGRCAGPLFEWCKRVRPRRCIKTGRWPTRLAFAVAVISRRPWMGSFESYGAEEV